jgi:hypothetical protein
MAYTMFLAIVLASENKKKPDLIKQEIQLRCGVTSVGNRFILSGLSLQMIIRMSVTQVRHLVFTLQK